MSRFELGERVTFSETVVKKRIAGGTDYVKPYSPPGTWTKAGLVPFTEGIVVGQKFLAKYSVHREAYDYDEGGLGFSSSTSYYTVIQQIRGTSRKAWLVAVHLRRKPILVLDEFIESMEEPAHDE